MNKIKVFIFASFVFLVFDINAALKVGIYGDDADQKVYASDSSLDYQPMTVIVPVSQGTALTSPVEVYIPINETSPDSTWDRKSYSALATPDRMPNFSGAGYLDLTLTVNNDSGEARFLVAAVYNSDSTYTPFLLVEPSSTTISNNSANSVAVNINFSLATGISGGICNINPMCEVKNSLLAKKVYFYLTTDTNKPTTNVAIAAASVPTNGVYFNFNFSNQLNSTEVTLKELQTYDERLRVIYSGESVANFYKTFIFQYTTGDLTVSNPVISVFSDIYPAAGDIYSYHGANASGEIFIKNLTNDLDYNFAVGFMDKYQFVTGVSSSLHGRPENIEEFLNKNACFLLSAGFKKDHYVLKYFRNVRDEFLMKNHYGQQFVEWYYLTAPAYAHIIWHSEFLSFGVRMAGFTAYLFLNFWYYGIFLFFLIGLVLYFSFVGKQKLRIKKFKFNITT